MDIDFGDMIDYLGNDPFTRSIVIYMEDTLGDVKKFISAARGFARNKPIVLIRPTQIDLAHRTGYTHTTILAGSDEAFDAVLKRVGVVRVRETQDLFNAASVRYSKHHPKGPNLAIISNAGGMGTLAANRLIRSGGRLVQFSPETLSALDAVMPSHCRRSNPIDVYRDADVDRFIRAMQICVDDPSTDGVLVSHDLRQSRRLGNV